MKPETPPPEPTIETRLLPLARRLYPGLGTARGQELTSGIANVVGLLYAAPLALVGMGWLVAVTDLALVRTVWPAFLLLLVLVFLLRRLGFFLFLEIKAGSYFDWPESLETIVTWSAALLFGPTALWLVVLWAVISYFFRWRQSVSTSLRWNLARNFGLEITRILAGLVALSLYERWGGVFPLPGLALDGVLPAFFATCVRFALSRRCTVAEDGPNCRHRPGLAWPGRSFRHPGSGTVRAEWPRGVPLSSRWRAADERAGPPVERNGGAQPAAVP
jgi:hypothetical protein